MNQSSANSENVGVGADLASRLRPMALDKTVATDASALSNAAAFGLSGKNSR